jgi:hypothetical protein
MKFVPIDKVEKEEPSYKFVPLGEEKEEDTGYTFVPLAESQPEEDKITGVKEKTKKGESVLAGTTLTPGTEVAPKQETFKLPGFEHLYPSEESPFNLSEQSRTEKLIMQGLDPEFARATARRNIAEQKATTGAEYGTARPLTKGEELGEELKYEAGKTGIEDTLQVLKRSGVKSVAGMAQAGGGMQKFVGEMLDLDTSDTDKTLNEINAFTQTMGEAPNKPVQLIEGAFQSIGEQLPALVAGTITGSQALVLTSMFANSFGQTYEDSRRRKLDPTDATARSAAYAAFEVLGEKIGLGDRLAALKKLANGVPEKDLAGFFAKALAKEIPGEEITYTGQFATDKLFGLNSEAGVKDFIQGAVDTMLVTAIQGGTMLGGGLAMRQISRGLGGGEKGTPEEPIKTAAELTQEKGFTFVPIEKAEAPAVEPAAPVTEPAVAAESTEPRVPTMANMKEDFDALLGTLKDKYNSSVDRVTTLATSLADRFAGAKKAETDEFGTLVNRYRDLGLTYEEAVTEAKKDYVEAGRGDELDTRAGKPGVSVPSTEPGTATGAPAAVGTGVGGPSAPAITTGSGEETKSSALKPVIEDGIKRYAASLIKNRVKDIASPESMGATANAALNKVIDNIETKLKSLGVSTERDAQGNMELENIIYQQIIPAAREQAFAKKEPTAEEDIAEQKRLIAKVNRARKAERLAESNEERVALQAKIDAARAELDAFYKESEPRTAKRFEEITGENYYEVGQQAIAAAEEKPVTRGKPRGRPKAELTEEEVAAKEALRKAQRATSKQATRTAENLRRIASEQFDPTQYDTEEGIAEGEKEFLARRRQALEDAYALTVQSATKNNKAGEIAQEVLDSANHVERELAKERYELRKKASRSELTESTNGVENEQYTEFKTAANALTWLMKKGNEFESTLARRLLPFVRNVRVVIVRDESDLPSAYLRKEFDGAAGMYYNNVIYLNAKGGLNNTVFLHEALHGATVDRIQKYIDDVEAGVEPDAKLAEAVEELNAVMKSAGRIYSVLVQYGKTSEEIDSLAIAGAFTNLKEFVAYGMSHPEMQNFLLEAPGMYSGVKLSFVDKLFTPFVQAIRKMFNMNAKHNSALQDLILVTDKLLTAQFAEPKVTKAEAALSKKQEKNIDKDENALRQSKSATEVEKLAGNMIKNHGVDGLIDLLDARFDALGNDFIAKLLYQMPTSAIVRWKGDVIPALASADTMMQEMSSMRMRLMTGVAKKAETLAKFISKNGSTELSDAMHLARLKKVSPTKYDTAAEYIQNDPLVQKYDQLIADPTTDPASLPAYEGQRTQRINQINAVYAKWEALGKQKDGHKMYMMVQEYYQDMYNLNRKLLDEQINKLQIDDASKAQLMKSVRLMYEQSVSNKSGEQETITLEDGTESVPVTFASLPEDYFPFTRRGKYYLDVQGPKGREFYMFESGNARNVFMAKRGRELGIPNARKDTTGIFKYGDDIHALRSQFQGDGMMLGEMFKIIDGMDKTKAPADFSEELKDQLYQVYLMTMPERSFRKQFLHAEKITGFSSDILRNLKDSGTKYSNQLAKLKYGVDLRGEIDRARDTLAGMPADERARLELFINEMSERVDAEINPPEDNPWVTRANQITYLMLLTSAATAGVQMLSIPNMVMPNLSEEYGYVKSAAKLTKYMQVWKSVGVTSVDPDTGETTFTAPSFTASDLARKNPNLSRAYQYAIEHYNTFSLTNTSVLTGAAKTPTTVGESAVRRGAQNVFTIITALLNGTERISREITFGMTFELEFEKTGNFEQSVKKAVESTQEWLGRYDAAERPRSWRGPVGKTVGQFKMYSVFMTSWFLRNGYTAIRISSPMSERMSSIRKLTGVILMGALFHGAVGSPLYSVIANLIDLYDWLRDKFGTEEDKKEMRMRKAKNPLTAFDSDMRFRYEFLPTYFGSTKIPGLDGRQHKLSDMLEKGPISVLSDINIGSRTSYDGMWIRDWKQGATTNETLMNFAAANFGPSISVGGNFVKAFDDFGNGKIQRGLEKFAPAFFKAPLVAYRAGEEGYRSQAGDLLLRKSEVSDGNLIAQALGFQPTRLTRIQEMGFKFAEEDKSAQASKEDILKRLNTAVNTGEPPEKFKKIFKDLAKHNRRYPHEAYEIDDDMIEKSIESYAGRKELTVRGLYIPEKKEEIMFPGVRATRPLK